MGRFGQPGNGSTTAVAAARVDARLVGDVRLQAQFLALVDERRAAQRQQQHRGSAGSALGAW